MGGEVLRKLHAIQGRDRKALIASSSEFGERHFPARRAMTLVHRRRAAAMNLEQAKGLKKRDFHEYADKLKYETRNFIDGKFVAARSGMPRL